MNKGKTKLSKTKDDSMGDATDVADLLSFAAVLSQSWRLSG